MKFYEILTFFVMFQFFEILILKKLRFPIYVPIFEKIFENCQLKTLLNSEISLYVMIFSRVYRNVDAPGAVNYFY